MSGLHYNGLPRRIIQTVEAYGPMSARHLARYLDTTLEHVGQTLRRLAGRNLIQQDDHGRWGTPATVNPAGHKARQAILAGDDWYDHRACIGADPTLFYNGDHLTEALTYCDECPVTLQCASLRVETERFYNSPAPGIWGGTLWTLASVGQNGYRARKAVA